MSDDTKQQLGPEGRPIDETSGIETTGHEWDGIRELNNPLPKWWLNTFYITVVWGLAITVLYPAWPMLTTHTEGVLGHSTRMEHHATLEKAAEAQSVFLDQIRAQPIEEVATNTQLTTFARAGGASAFAANCSQCHGAGAAGGLGYPNLLDDDWLWGGSLEAIEATIAHGIRQLDEEGYPLGDTRDSEMPGFGRDELLSGEEIAQSVEYVLKVSGQEHDAAQAAAGETLFADNCAACHGDDAQGLRDLGAPNLTDAIWLYGGDREALTATIVNGRRGMMPAWNTRLDPAVIRMLAIYVHGLGGGEAGETSLSQLAE